jgi:hypothetical protein
METDYGGAEVLSVAERLLIRRAAMICIACEQMERETAAGKSLDAERYSVMTGHLTRVFQTLGLKRRARDTRVTLQDYLAAAHRPREDTDPRAN